MWLLIVHSVYKNNEPPLDLLAHLRLASQYLGCILDVPSHHFVLIKRIVCAVIVLYESSVILDYDFEL